MIWLRARERIRAPGVLALALVTAWCTGCPWGEDPTLDDDTTACAPPVITSIDGDGTQAVVVDDWDLTEGILDPQPAEHRFQEAWIVSGEHLDCEPAKDWEFELAPADGVSTHHFTQADGLVFDINYPGANTMEQRLLLPTDPARFGIPLAAYGAAFVLTLTNPTGGSAQAQTFILQGEQGVPGLDGVDGGNCWDLIGDANGDNITDADDCLPGESQCPFGYDVTDYSTAGGAICENPLNGDEMVQVGDFWIDRYEISIWDGPDWFATQYGYHDVTQDNYDSVGFYDNGNWEAPLYAWSFESVTPSRYMTWFQAQQACELSGKSLCTNEQWQAAAAGTHDETHYCNIDHLMLEATGHNNNSCESSWGAVDMVGNLWEWVALWEGHPGWNGITNQMSPEYGTDGYFAGGETYDFMPSYGISDSWRPYSPGISGNGDDEDEYFGPAAVLRGGAWSDASSAGVFALHLHHGPSHSGSSIGARCCRQE